MTEWVYETNENNTFMYVLGTKGENPLICLGVYPGQASPKRMDMSTKSVEQIAKENGYDSWIQIHVCAKRRDYFQHQNHKGHHKAHLENLRVIREILNHYKAMEELPICATFGDQIFENDFLVSYLRDIYALTSEYKNVNWYAIGMDKHGIPKDSQYYMSNKKICVLCMEDLLAVL